MAASMPEQRKTAKNQSVCNTSYRPSRGRFLRFTKSMRGRILLADFHLDLSGYGETKDSQSKYSNEKFRTSVVTMYNGRPLLGRSVEEIMASMGRLLARGGIDSSNVHLLSVGDAVTAIMHAGALDTRVIHVELSCPSDNPSH
jgi:hypothetical protein